MTALNEIAAKLFPWIATAFLGLLSFLGAGLYARQEGVTVALAENTAAIRELAAKFAGYVELNDARFEAASEHRQRLEEGQKEIRSRLDRSGMSQ